MDLLPSQEELNAKYRYDSETGILYFKHHRERRYIGRPVGGLDCYGYLVTSSNGKHVKVHRIIWKLVYNETPDTIDHINGNKTDNRILNLRSVTSSENVKSRFASLVIPGIYTRMYSIRYHKGISRWVVRSKRKHIRCFKTIDEAKEWVSKIWPV